MLPSIDPATGHTGFQNKERNFLGIASCSSRDGTDRAFEMNIRWARDRTEGDESVWSGDEICT